MKGGGDCIEAPKDACPIVFTFQANLAGRLSKPSGKHIRHVALRSLGWFAVNLALEIPT